MSDEKKYSGYGYHGGGVKKGQKIKDVTKDFAIHIKVTAEQKQQLQEMAKAQGKTVSKFLLDLAFSK